MTDKVTELDSKNFPAFIKKGNAVVDLWAAWCSPCKILSPVVEEVASESKKVKFGKVDVDKELEIAQKYQVLSIPTILYFKDGELVNKTVGALSKEDLEEEIEESFS